MKKIIWMVAIIGLSVILAACETHRSSEDGGSFAADPLYMPFDGEIEHIHGLGYAGNQNAIFFAAHDGIKVYDHGKWFKTKKENNDYMGFNAVKKGFYTSGHPGVDSELKNPIGIKASFDNGKTLIDLGLEGETDFHLLGVGYEKNVIYAISPQQNSLMEGNRLYVSENNAKTWRKVAAKGLSNEVFSLAVHPTDPTRVAAIGKEGVYLSEDGGESFRIITNGLYGTAIFFTKDHLYYGGYNGEALLIKRSLKEGSEEKIKLPTLVDDAVQYLAQNPQNEQELVFSTYQGDIYQTTDGAKTWKLLVGKGKLQ